MRYFTLVALVWACSLAAPARAQTPNAELMAPIQKFMDTFNKGDMAGAAATHAADDGLAIIDEVPPFLWRGANAFQEWSADLDADAKKQGMTEPKATISAPTRVETSGDQAYVVAPAVLTFKLRGVAMRGAAQMTFVLTKGTGGWLIHGWTWTGRKAQPVAGAAKK